MISYWVMPTITSRLPPEKKTVEQIVCEHFGIEIDHLYQKSRAAGVRTPRQVCSYIYNKHLKMHLVDIADRYGQDKSTVLSSVRVIQNYIDTEPEFAEMMAGFIEKVKEGK